MMAKGASTVDAAAVYVSITAFAWAEYTIPMKARLRGDHPAVVSNPQFFLRDGASDTEIDAAFQSLVKEPEARDA